MLTVIADEFRRVASAKSVEMQIGVEEYVLTPAYLKAIRDLCLLLHR
jgi:hypothetical protein